MKCWNWGFAVDQTKKCRLTVMSKGRKSQHAEVQEIEELDDVHPGSPSEAEEEEEVEPPNYLGYNEVGELVDADGDILVEGVDYVSEEIAAEVPHKRQGALGARLLTSDDNPVRYGLYHEDFTPKSVAGKNRKSGAGRIEPAHKEDELIQFKREAKLKGGARDKQYAQEPLNPKDEAEEEQVTPLKWKKKLPASPKPVEHAIRIREPISPARPSPPVFGKRKAVMSEIRSMSDMSRQMIDALRKRMGRSSSASPPAKKSKGGEGSSSKEKRPSGEAPTPPLPVLPEAKKGKEMLAREPAGSSVQAGLKLAYTYSRAKSAASKNVALSDTLKAEADLAKKEAEEARAEAGAIRLELGEANKKLFAAEKKITVLTKDLEVADRFEETIEILSTEVNSLQDERTSLREVLHRMKEEKDSKDGELSTEVDKLKEKVNALETTVLELFFDFWKANPQANFDYLGDAKDMYLEYCAAQVAYGRTEAATSTSDQTADAPPV
ncbi:uncharacterized protein LOC133030091 [Cannabis sativa]|uniref:uncharacterized protein LOC133030091 n=1 Tax=Cannabis sativa TaxID=3483 RepID=UPI0029C9CD94|nr:uncharacterized protein LOC133030091 [Cannabis sativa]